MLFVLIFFLLKLLIIGSPARNPVSVEACLVRGCQKYLLSFVLEFHLNAHLLEGAEYLAVQEAVNLLPDTFRIAEDSLHVEFQVLQSLYKLREGETLVGL